MTARRFVLAVLSLFILQTFIPIAFAQSDEDDDASGFVRKFAQLTVSVKPNGSATVDYSYFEPIADLDATKLALAQATGCPASSFAYKHMFSEDLSRITDAKRRKAMQDASDRYSRSGLQARCTGLALRQGLVKTAGIETAPLIQLLKPAQVEDLYLSIWYPDEGSQRSSELYRSSGRNTFVLYNIPVQSATPTRIWVGWGFERRDLVGMGAVLCCFLVLPIAACYWVRRKALALGATDPTAAWFSYFRTVNLCGNGVFLFWMVAGNTSRKGMIGLIALLAGTHSNLAIAAILALTILPPWIVYFICLSGSYKVLVQIRGIEWKRSEFLLSQFLTVAALLIPVASIVCFFQIKSISFRTALAVIIAGWILTILCARWKIKVNKTQSEPVSTGELRDRIFGLAQRAGVTLKHLFVMPAGKMQVANAFAAGNQVVTFTDYVLQRLNKREVDAIAGHELSHLRYKHPTKLGMMLLLVIFLPVIVPFLFGALGGVVVGLVWNISHNHRLQTRLIDLLINVWHSPWADPIILSIGLLLFYAVSRRFERSADEGAVQLTSDPEALITGLLKISKLNLMPFQWSKSTGMFLTHPSMLKRVQHIASIGNVSDERLHQILSEHSNNSAVPDPADYYLVPDISNCVVTTTAQVQRSQTNLLLLLAGHVLPATLVAWFAIRTGFVRAHAPIIYAVGAILCIVFYILMSRTIALRGRKKLRANFEQKFRREGLLLDYEKARVVGFSPGPHPRFYVANYNWDNGLVIFRRGSLFFLGDQTRFRIPVEHIARVWIGQGAPSFLPVKRVYIQTVDPSTGRSDWLNFAQMERCSAFGLARQTRKLFEAIEHWRTHQASYANPPDDLMKLAPPQIGAVTCQPPTRISTVRKEMNYIVIFAVLTWLAVRGLNLDAFLYVFGVVLALRLYEMLPYRFYSDRSPDGKRIRASKPSRDALAVQLPTS